MATGQRPWRQVMATVSRMDVSREYGLRFRLLRAMRPGFAALVLSVLSVHLSVGSAAFGQSPPPPAPTAAAFSGNETSLSAAQLETLVGPVALYPDDLLALVLPASTQPVQIVEAQRLL